MHVQLLPLERAGSKVTLKIDQLEDLGALVNLQESRPNNGLSLLRIKCGGAAYEDMIMVIPQAWTACPAATPASRACDAE